MICTDYLSSPAGIISIKADDDYILSIGFVDTAGMAKPNALTQACAAQLSEYFEGKQSAFDLPLKIQGTSFQKAVWEALRAIPCGETRSYEDIARAVGSPGGVRAVGGANARNVFTIVIPCHRVIRKDGSIGGYGGGVPRKAFLLAHESTCSNPRRNNL